MDVSNVEFQGDLSIEEDDYNQGPLRLRMETRVQMTPGPHTIFIFRVHT